ncbi:GDP-mannose 4,6-dehydratase [bacterium]|nr:GDP-mannose 4,6-dehydratase [bacterium]
MKRVFLTGCCGFIGWKVGEILLKRGYDVFGVDNLNNYYDVRLKEWRLERLSKRNIKFEKADISNPDIKKLIKKFSPDVIINLAARAGVRSSIEEPFIYFRTNTLGTLNLLEICKELGIKKFILASTSSLYAGQKTPFSEKLAVNTPISPYAASKKGAEVICYTYHYLYGINTIIFRYFTVYGPCGRPDMSVFKFIKLIDEGKEITVYGNGNQSRDFTYVDDIAKGTIKGIKLDGFEIINLGNNRPYKLNEMIGLIERNLGKKAKIKYAPFNKADIKKTHADIRKAKRLLKWEPEIDLPEGIRKTVLWHKKNRSFLKEIKLNP